MEAFTDDYLKSGALVARLGNSPDNTFNDPVEPWYAIRVRRTANGAKYSHQYQWRDATGTQRKLGLGKWPAKKVLAVRKTAAWIDTQRCLGVDPREATGRERRVAKSNLGAILEDGGPYDLSLNKGSRTGGELANKATMFATVTRVLLKQGKLHSLPIADLSAAQVERLCDAIDGRGAKEEAYRQIRRLLRWARKPYCDGKCALDGDDYIKRLGGKPRRSDYDEDDDGRNLAEDPAELRRVWAATATDHPYHAAMRFALLAGVRRIEAAELNREMVGTRIGDRFVTTSLAKADRVCLPASVTKSRKPHDIPITPMIRALLASRPTAFDRYFTHSGKALSSWDDDALRLTKDAAMADKFKAHDMRKTCRSIMAAEKVDADFGDDFGGFCIGHRPAGLERIYNKAKRWPDRVEATTRVCTYISNIVQRAEQPEPLPIAA